MADYKVDGFVEKVGFIEIELFSDGNARIRRTLNGEKPQFPQEYSEGNADHVVYFFDYNGRPDYFIVSIRHGNRLDMIDVEADQERTAAEVTCELTDPLPRMGADDEDGDASYVYDYNLRPGP